MLELSFGRWIAVAVLLAASVAAVGGCGRKLDQAECNNLLDRYTELLVKDEEPGAAPERVVQAQARARETALRDARFDFSSCSSRVSRSEYECAMTAPTVDAVERCLVF